MDSEPPRPYLGDHLLPIGVLFANPDNPDQQFSKLGEESVRTGEQIKTREPHGIYTRLPLGKGAELFFQFQIHSEGGKTFARNIGMNPHFAGSARTRVRLVQRVSAPHFNCMEGAYKAWSSPENSDSEGLRSFVFEMPDYACHNDLVLPKVVEIQLVAFGYKLHAFADDLEFEKSRFNRMFEAQPEGKTVTVKTAAAGHAFSPMPGGAEATLVGRVKEMQLLANPSPYVPFLRMRLETGVGELDLVACPREVEGTLQSGGVVWASCWLTGRILKQDTPLAGS